MNKTNRLTLLRSRYTALFGVALTSGLIAPSRAEIRGVAQSVKSGAVQGIDDNLASGDEVVAPDGFTSLHIEPVSSGGFGLRGESDSHFVLTPAERKELNRVRPYRPTVHFRAPAPVALPGDELLSPDFVPAPIDPEGIFTPAIPKGAQWVAEAEEQARHEYRFECDVQALPLLLTA